MSYLLQVSLWYVEGMGEIWHGDCGYTHAQTLPKQDGQSLSLSQNSMDNLQEEIY